ncbi:uncharacterized protein LOC136073053 [Hydra vulgaris]|uniref:uncharacterized protein LOC136073053 n=1 Tax=Hydra vulgaris TaxID=6087 RepID=UPI0032E9C600
MAMTGDWNQPATLVGEGTLLTEKNNDAETELIINAQKKTFAEEYNQLINNKGISKTSYLLKLLPRLDENKMLRCDSRLKNAEFLSFNTRYPIILPRYNHITKLIVKDCHEAGQHMYGVNHILAELSTKYWVVSGREKIKKWEAECAECKRRKAKLATQIMAPLPTKRLQFSMNAFEKCAVDYGGPFITIQGRRKKRAKRYLALFTCLSSRAVPLEVAFALDAESFLNAFFRMSSRRGTLKEMISDNGGNFVLANKELRSFTDSEKKRINEATSHVGIKWHFIPPAAPHFGGVHEIMIKAAKRAIYSQLGNADITDKELITAFAGAEKLTNSGPLTYQSSDPKDCTPLTPNDFLFGQIGGKFAADAVDATSFNPKRRWRRVQELIKHFWHRWMKEWLPMLGPRKKWNIVMGNLLVGDLVLVLSENTSKDNWPLGRVTEVFPGNDGLVRVANVQVGKVILKHPITKLCPLELNEPEDVDHLVKREEYVHEAISVNNSLM